MIYSVLIDRETFRSRTQDNAMLPLEEGREVNPIPQSDVPSKPAHELSQGRFLAALVVHLTGCSRGERCTRYPLLPSVHHANW